MNLDSFHCVGGILLNMGKKLLNNVFIIFSKYENVFCHPSLHQMFSGLLFVLIFFKKKSTCVEPLKNPFSLHWIGL